MKTILTFMLLSVLSLPAMAAHSGEAAAPATPAAPAAPSAPAATCNGVMVKVNGLVCDFCARALEKVFGEKNEVEKINVNLDKGEIAITLKPGQTLDEAIIKKLVEDAGYTPTDVKKGC